jgi:hypothetical protein
LNDRWSTRATIVLLMAIAVPLVVALVSVSRERWYPTGDMAQAELHVAGFFRHPPLVGAAGRIGSILAPYGQGSHPGPALWVALLPVYLLTGRSSFGIELAMSFLQLAFIVATVLITRRVYGAIGGLVVAAFAAVLVHALGPAPFIEPWNPWGALFAFFCFVSLCWGIMCGHHRFLPGAAFSGFFAVQCHAGYAALVGVTLAAMVGFVIWQWRAVGVADNDDNDDDDDDKRPNPADAPGATRSAILRSWWIAVAVTVVMWLPPVVDQIRRTPGNLRILWDHFTATTEADGSPRVFVGGSSALRAFAGEFAMPGPWVRGAFRQPTDSPNLVAFILAVVIVAAIVVALARRRALPERGILIRLFVLLGVLTVVGIISMSRIFGEFYDYVIRWWWVIIAWVFAACALALARLFRERWVAVSALVVGLVMSGLATAHAIGEQNPGPRNSRLVGGVVPQITDDLDRNDRYLIRWHDPATLGGVPFGMLLELEKEGFHVGVDAPSSAGALPHRVLPEGSANSVLWVILGETNIEQMRTQTDAIELGYFDQRSPAEVEESNALREHLNDRLRELDLECLVPVLDSQYGQAAFVLGGAPVPQDVADTAGAYNLLGLPVAVFELPPFVAPFQPPPSSC